MPECAILRCYLYLAEFRRIVSEGEVALGASAVQENRSLCWLIEILREKDEWRNPDAAGNE
jgi:hypothetical protein